MEKIKNASLLLVAAVIVNFAACKKNRVCTCAIDTPQGVIVTKTTLYDVKKSEGRNNRIGSQTITETASTITKSNKTTCTLK